jgi:hypothetical protein
MTLTRVCTGRPSSEAGRCGLRSSHVTSAPPVSLPQGLCPPSPNFSVLPPTVAASRSTVVRRVNWSRAAAVRQYAVQRRNLWTVREPLLWYLPQRLWEPLSDERIARVVLVSKAVLCVPPLVALSLPVFWRAVMWWAWVLLFPLLRLCWSFAAVLLVTGWATGDFAPGLLTTARLAAARFTRRHVREWVPLATFVLALCLAAWVAVAGYTPSVYSVVLLWVWRNSLPVARGVVLYFCVCVAVDFAERRRQALQPRLVTVAALVLLPLAGAGIVDTGLWYFGWRDGWETHIARVGGYILRVAVWPRVAHVAFRLAAAGARGVWRGFGVSGGLLASFRVFRETSRFYLGRAMKYAMFLGALEVGAIWVLGEPIGLPHWVVLWQCAVHAVSLACIIAASVGIPVAVWFVCFAVLFRHDDASDAVPIVACILAGLALLLVVAQAASVWVRAALRLRRSLPVAACFGFDVWRRSCII